MTRNLTLFASFLALLILMGADKPASFEVDGNLPPMALSEYGAFIGELKDLNPAEGVVPYELNTPLFSDYAHKTRFVQLPDGATVPCNKDKVLDFPVGTRIYKTFWYPKDERKPNKGRFLIETRVLIHEESGWKAWPYVWDEKQTDAVLEVAGARKDISWVDENGKKQKLNYVVPNQNQCKGCHKQYAELGPIGPTARQLNGELAYPDGSSANQLAHWAAKGLLTDFPGAEAAPKAPVWNDPNSGSLEARARAYLDINCAHCHNPDGPANTSGLFLDVHQTDPGMLGVEKPPIAAGRGSGDRQYGILPGQPNQSILLYRMEAEDPGIMMPELGRKMVHKEGVELIRDWITAMN